MAGVPIGLELTDVIEFVSEAMARLIVFSKNSLVTLPANIPFSSMIARKPSSIIPGRERIDV